MMSLSAMVAGLALLTFSATPSPSQQDALAFLAQRQLPNALSDPADSTAFFDINNPHFSIPFPIGDMPIDFGSSHDWVCLYQTLVLPRRLTIGRLALDRITRCLLWSETSQPRILGKEVLERFRHAIRSLIYVIVRYNVSIRRNDTPFNKAFCKTEYHISKPLALFDNMVPSCFRNSADH